MTAVPTTCVAATAARRIRVPFLDLQIQTEAVRAEVERGWRHVIEGSSFVLGDVVEEFEELFAAYCSSSDCVGVGSGTDALEIALLSLGIGPGDEVIVPALTFVASASPVVRCGATPVFVDVDPATLLIDCGAVEAAIGPRTAAVVAVDLYGQLPVMEELEAIATRHGLVLIEDAAQSQGADRHGRAIGHSARVAATSFYPGKNLGAWGDGGAILTRDPEVASAARAIRNHGGQRKYEHLRIGVNSRLDSLQAVVLRAKLAHLDDWNRARDEAAGRYSRLLQNVPGVAPVSALPGNRHVWHLYVVQVAQRDKVRALMADEGIETGIHYPETIPHLEAFESLGTRRGAFPVAEAAVKRILSLPMFPGISGVQQDHVIEALSRIVFS